MIRLLFISMMLILSTEAFGQGLKVLPDSEITFSLSNLKWNTVNGSIGGLRAEGHFDPGKPGSSDFEVSAAVSTIETGIGKRDRHLQEEEFFHSEVYPRIIVKSEEVMHAAAESRYQFNGTLTIKDITKPLACAFFLKKEGSRVVLEGDFTVNRTDFELGSSYGSFVIGEEIEVHVKLVCDEI